MPTYENPNTGVIHWISTKRIQWNRTACGLVGKFMDHLSLHLVDPVGVPADVTCGRCRATWAFVDDEQAMGDE